MRDFTKAFLPPGSERRRLVGHTLRKLHLMGRKHPDIHYAEWVERSEPFLWSKPEKLDYQPLISVITPVFNPPAKYLLPMVYSVVGQQHYDNWELILVNASTDPKARRLTARCAKIDKRIKVIDIEDNRGIAGNTDAGVEAANGEYIALLDHDDLLAPPALYEMARALQATPRPQLLYSDEDKISENSQYRFDPFFKPDWSPYLLRHVNYLNHLSLIEKKLLKATGGYRKGFEGAQDYDLFLRLTDKQPVIAHVPKILYHWRTAIGSTAHNFKSKSNVRDAGIKALEDHLQRQRQVGEVSTLDKQPGFYRVDYKMSRHSRLAILVMPTIIHGQYNYLVSTILKHTEVSTPTDLIVCGQGQSRPTLPEHINLIEVDASEPSAFIKQALAKTKADNLIIVNCSVKPASKHWAANLAGLIDQDKNIGVAAPLLVDDLAKNVIDAGFVYQADQAVPLFEGLLIKTNTYLGNVIWGRNIDYPSGRLIALRREVYDEYFADKAPTVNGDQAVYRAMAANNLAAIVCMDNQLHFTGDLQPVTKSSDYFNANIIDRRRGISLPKTINVPPEDWQ